MKHHFSRPFCSLLPLPSLLGKDRRQTSFLSPCMALNLETHEVDYKFELKVIHYYLNTWENNVKTKCDIFTWFCKCKLVTNSQSLAWLRLTIQGALPLKCKICTLYTWLSNICLLTTEIYCLFLWFQKDAKTQPANPSLLPPLQCVLSSLVTEQQGRTHTVWRGQCSHHGRRLHTPCTWSWLLIGSNILKACPLCCCLQEMPEQEWSGRGCLDS